MTRLKLKVYSNSSQSSHYSHEPLSIPPEPGWTVNSVNGVNLFTKHLKWENIIDTHLTPEAQSLNARIVAENALCATSTMKHRIICLISTGAATGADTIIWTHILMDMLSQMETRSIGAINQDHISPPFRQRQNCLQYISLWKCWGKHWRNIAIITFSITLWKMFPSPSNRMTLRS